MNFRCRLDSGEYKNVEWIYLYPKCIRNNGQCNALAGAYVAAAYACRQRLFI